MQLSTSEKINPTFDLQSLWADRIGGTFFGQTNTLYKFEKIKRAKACAKEKHPLTPLLDFGIGEPDATADKIIIETLKEEVNHPHNNSYADNGHFDFNKAVAQYMQETYNVELAPQTEIMHAMGGKAALSLLPLCFINPGDYLLNTTPGYPILSTHARYLGGKVFSFPLLEEKKYLPDFSIVPNDILKRSKILLLNYPNNPTGACATSEFYQEAIAFAKKYNIIIIQDAAYGPLTYNNRPLSILENTEAKDVAIEIHSLSKAFNMTGWRMGWVCGNPDIIRAYGQVKSNTDSGQFLPIQHAAAKALKTPKIIENNVSKYNRRLNMLTETLKILGFKAKCPEGSFFLYTQSPKQAENDQEYIEFESAEAFSQWLIENFCICSVPWDDAGHYVRFSATFKAKSPEQELSIMNQLAHRLKGWKFTF